MTLSFPILWLFMPYLFPMVYFLVMRDKRHFLFIYVSLGTLILTGASIYCIVGLFGFPLWAMALAAASGQFILFLPMILRHRKRYKSAQPVVEDKSLQWALVAVGIFFGTLTVWLGHLSVESWLPLIVPIFAFLYSVFLVVVFLIRHSSTRWQKALLLLFLAAYGCMVGKDGYKHLSIWGAQISQKVVPRMKVSELVEDAMDGWTLTPYASLLKVLPGDERRRAVQLLGQKLSISVSSRQRALELLSEILDNKSLAEIVAAHWNHESPFGDKRTLDVLAYSGEARCADMILSAWSSKELDDKRDVVSCLKRLLADKFDDYLVRKIGAGTSEEAAWAWDVLKEHAGMEATRIVRWHWQDDYKFMLPDVVEALKNDQLTKERTKALLLAYASPNSSQVLKQVIIGTFIARADEAVWLLKPRLISGNLRDDVLEILDALPNRRAVCSLVRSVWKPTDPIPGELVAEAVSERGFILSNPAFVVTFLNALSQPANFRVLKIAQQVLEEANDFTQDACETLLFLTEAKEASVREASSEIILKQFLSDNWWTRGYAKKATGRLVHRAAGKAEEYPEEAYQLLLRIAPIAARRLRITSEGWLHDAIVQNWREDGVIRYPEFALALSSIKGGEMNPELVGFVLNEDVSLEMRQKCLRMLCRLNTSEGAIKLFLSSLKDGDTVHSAWNAIQNIVAISPGADLRIVIRANWHVDYQIPSLEVLEILSFQIRPLYLTPIIRCLGSGQPSLEEAARKTLLKYDSQKLFPVLLRELMEGNSAATRAEIIRLIGRLDLNKKLRGQAKRAVKRICGVGLFQFQVSDEKVVRAAFDTLVQLNRR